jgi:hypothetical protein
MMWSARIMIIGGTASSQAFASVLGQDTRA